MYKHRWNKKKTRILLIINHIISCHFPLPLLLYYVQVEFGSGELKRMRLVLKVSPFQYDQPISS